MIFPDEKTLKVAADGWQCQNTFIAAANWAIQFIKDNASEGLEKSFPNGRNSQGETPSQVELWQAATISSEARHLKELQAKDAEIKELNNTNGIVCECMTSCDCLDKELEALRLENKELREAVLDFKNTLDEYSSSDGSDCPAWVVIEKHSMVLQKLLIQKLTAAKEVEE